MSVWSLDCTDYFFIAKLIRIKRIYLFKKDILWYNETKKVLLNRGIE